MNPAFHLIGGKLLLNRCGGQRLVASTPSDETEDSGCDSSANCIVQSSGTSSGFGWFLGSGEPLTVENLPTKLPIVIQFKYPNSTNCGNGPGASSGVVRSYFQVDPCCCGIDVKLSVSGTVEQQNSGYDSGRIALGSSFVAQADGALTGLSAQIGSFNRGLGCAMIQTENSNTGRAVPTLDSAGIHRFFYNIVVNTNDGLYHQDMVHTFKIERATSSNA